ncbi:MAG: stage sporulation protein [Eubacteriales bacterium]|nr:stage sporulation protein [Eubacteriales bacterium]MDN5363387.1 stage sporulation protein [Eubacteriales bacterium]
MQAAKKVGKQTIKFTQPPCIISTHTVVGPKEGRGPLGKFFDYTIPDNLWGEQSFEKCEQKMLQEALEQALQKANLSPQQVDYLLAGDLLNQIICANYTARNLGIPFLGLYGACSTMAEALILGAMLIDGGYANYVLGGASSHYDTAERQYRYPTEQGVQRPPTAQWTVTGAGGFLLAHPSLAPAGPGLKVTFATLGRVIDMAIADVNNMGAAMAPAAVDTIIQHFKDTGRSPVDYQLIITGDLGSLGKTLCLNMLEKAGYDVEKIYTDCGVLIYDPSQDTHCGGSGCGCSAVVMAAYVFRRMQEGAYRRVLFAGTGALMSPTSVWQGETIPGIAHAVAIEFF